MENRIRRLGLLLIFVVLAACGPSKEQQKKLDVAYGSARNQAMARIVVMRMASRSPKLGVDPDAIPFEPRPAMLEEGFPILYRAPPRPWVVLMKDGPGAFEMTIEAYGESATKPVRSEVVRSHDG
jgi:hypothetical protein